MEQKTKQSIWQILWIGAIVIIGAQINMNLFIVNFKVSIGIMMFPISLVLFGSYPVIPTTILSALGVWGSRSLVHWFQNGEIIFDRFFPEMIFYLVFGLLFSLYCNKNKDELDTKAVFWLFLFDYFSNLSELILRLHGEAFSLSSQSSILLVAISRALILWCFLSSMNYYKFSLLRQKHAQRYQRLLLLISKLNSEVVWMNKNTKLIENTMNKSYQLFQLMKDQGVDEELSKTALDVAKDIHEVKKEYMLILRGLSEAMELNLKDEGMYLQDILTVLKNSLSASVSEGRKLEMDVDIQENLYTHNHYFLMSIFRNLFNNAVEASKNEVIHLKFSQSCQEENYLFQIIDDGPGILPEDIEQIFSPGFSTKINYETGEINRGLGLNLVQDLVENQWHGKIWVESEPGNTVFSIRIPKEQWKEIL